MANKKTMFPLAAQAAEERAARRNGGMFSDVPTSEAADPQAGKPGPLTFPEATQAAARHRAVVEDRDREESEQEATQPLGPIRLDLKNLWRTASMPVADEIVSRLEVDARKSPRAEDRREAALKVAFINAIRAGEAEALEEFGSVEVDGLGRIRGIGADGSRVTIDGISAEGIEVPAYDDSGTTAEARRSELRDGMAQAIEERDNPVSSKPEDRQPLRGGVG